MYSSALRGTFIWGNSGEFSGSAAVVCLVLMDSFVVDCLGQWIRRKGLDTTSAGGGREVRNSSLIVVHQSLMTNLCRCVNTEWIKDGKLTCLTPRGSGKASAALVEWKDY